MAIYTFYNKESDEYIELEMPMAEREPFLEANPHLEQALTKAPSIGDAVRLGFVKPAEGFRDMLREMNKAHPKGRINVV